MRDIDKAICIAAVGKDYKLWSLLRHMPEGQFYDRLRSYVNLSQSEILQRKRQYISKNISAHYLCPSCPDYPASFFNLKKPPLILSLIGPTRPMRQPGLSVVGSREPDGRFLKWLDIELMAFLALHPIPVISGGARGIDQKASTVAALCSANTLIYLPSGLDCMYPIALRSFLDFPQVTFISEYPANCPMKRHHFYRRNELIAAHGAALFAVQLKVKSGSMITARYAYEAGKEVWTIPDFPTESRSTGNLHLIDSGASIISSHLDMSCAWGLTSFCTEVSKLET